MLETLTRLVTDGLDPATVEAALNTVEFRLRESQLEGLPRGLLWMLRALGTWLHEGDPLAPLAFEAPLNTIKQRVFYNRKEPHFIIENDRT